MEHRKEKKKIGKKIEALQWLLREEERNKKEKKGLEREKRGLGTRSRLELWEVFFCGNSTK